MLLAERGLATEVEVGPDNGLSEQGIVICDNIVTIQAASLGPVAGYLLPSQGSIMTSVSIRITEGSD